MSTEPLNASETFDPGPPPELVLEVRLTEEQVDQFHRDGFTSVDRITTDEELEWLAPIYDFLFAGKRGSWKGSYFDLARPYDSEGETNRPMASTISAERIQPIAQTTMARVVLS